jgi:hypothetical protein
MQIIAPFVVKLSIVGFVVCWVAAVAAWIHLAVAFIPFWWKTMKLSREKRSQLISYLFAPRSSFEDSWLDPEVKTLLPALLIIRPRFLRIFACGLCGMAFGYVGTIAENFK